MVERLLGDAVLAAHFSDWCADLRLLQREGELPVLPAALPHARSLP